MMATFPNVQSLSLETVFVAVRPPKVDFSRLWGGRTVVDVFLGGPIVQSDPVIATEDAAFVADHNFSEDVPATAAFYQSWADEWGDDEDYA